MSEQTLPNPMPQGNVVSRIMYSRYTRLILILVFAASVLLPIVFMATTSIKQPIEIRESGAILPTRGIFTENWGRAFANVPLVRYLFNSTVVAVTSTLLALLIAVPATYSIVRFRTGGMVLPSLILGTYVMPPIVVSIPIFMMTRIAGLTDTLFGLILLHGMANLPVAVWLIDSYIRSLPVELEQAAWVDGYGRFETLLKVVIPLIRPGIVSAGMICMILSWNEFLFALILTYSDVSHTFPIGISRYEGEHGLQFGEMAAAALTGIIPIYLIVLFFQRYLVEGLTQGGVRG
ncbi:MAG: carbohydrate ABC transporter permease [Chloroflexi bacterium]|nr:MAG: carbohydrate ABC transporter permease [Chloroflexota bacterium]MBL1193809.1 carbohydrate ABC transporter permease [Chloroflexota bacterium]NOH11102.1 carbohydrate ABC transporter permease [Chloroflexota bacterium]